MKQLSGSNESISLMITHLGTVGCQNSFFVHCALPKSGLTRKGVAEKKEHCMGRWSSLLWLPVMNGRKEAGSEQARFVFTSRPIVLSFERGHSLPAQRAAELGRQVRGRPSPLPPFKGQHSIDNVTSLSARTRVLGCTCVSRPSLCLASFGLNETNG